MLRDQFQNGGDYEKDLLEVDCVSIKIQRFGKTNLQRSKGQSLKSDEVCFKTPVVAKVPNMKPFIVKKKKKPQANTRINSPRSPVRDLFENLSPWNDSEQDDQEMS